MTKIVLLFSILVINSGGCQAAASTLSFENYVQILQSIEDIDDPRILEAETQTISDFIFLIKNHQLNMFYKNRDRLQKLLTTKTPFYSWYWMQRIDNKILATYLYEVSEILKKSRLPHLQNLAERFKEDLSNQEINLSYIKKIYYGEANLHSRGFYYSDKKEISIEISPPDEIIVPLMHEMTHYYDQELIDARTHLSELTADANEFSPKNFGRYWFLRKSYIPYYKEAVPRLNACLAFIDLYRQKIIQKPAPRDLERYSPVLNNNKSCSDLTSEELRLEFPNIEFFWSEGRLQADLVNQYIRGWESDHGFNTPIYIKP